ncbi:MAG: hypothetical protein K0R15_184 [Clostridiales bacterium]|jgi:multimeric flavodoxin WrbA|nr:hypothetical protein [Clostridiales bacterium]
MKIALINGSPKVKDSASNAILQELKKFLGDEPIIIQEHFKSPEIKEEQMESILDCEAIVFAFPLYVDGIPSHLLHCLVRFQEYIDKIGKKEIVVYTLVNCGFYEGKHNALAIDMMKHWTKKSGLKWGQGIGIGAGGMIPGLGNVPAGHGPKKNLGTALKIISDNIVNSSEGETLFITANFPRFAYKLAAEFGWRKAIKANGLRRKDLFRKKV